MTRSARVFLRLLVHADSLQTLLGGLLVSVALWAVDWRLGLGSAGAALLLDRYLERKGGTP